MDGGGSQGDKKDERLSTADCGSNCIYGGGRVYGFVARQGGKRFGLGVRIMIKTCKKYDTYYAFLVQEEVGLRGAAAATRAVEPDVAVVIETTTAADIAGVDEDRRVCRQGNGTVRNWQFLVFFMFEGLACAEWRRLFCAIFVGKQRK